MSLPTNLSKPNTLIAGTDALAADINGNLDYITTAQNASNTQTNTNTDEIVTARNGAASLDARLDSADTDRNLKAYANNAALTGIPVAPTAAADTDTTQLATTAFAKKEADDAQAYSIQRANHTGTQAVSTLTGVSAATQTFLTAPTSTTLRQSINDGTGAGAAVFGTSPTIITPTLSNVTMTNGGALGTPASGTLTNCTGLPISTGVAGLGTGVATALAVNVGSAGAPVVLNGALGTPSSGTVTNLTGTASININGTVGATTPAAGTFTTLTSTGNATLGDAEATDTHAIKGATTVLANSSSAALTVTQTGTGNAFVVEDSTSPDSTPVVINENGRVLVGHTTSVSASIGAGLVQVNDYVGAPSFQGYRYTADVSPTWLILGKSRSTSPNSKSVVSSNDGIANIGFEADDGTNFIRAALITAAVDGTPGTNDMPGRLVFSTTADGAASPTERMRIDSAGNVGIGATPAAYQKLSVSGLYPVGSAITELVSLRGTIAAGTTSSASMFLSRIVTEAASFTLPILRHFHVNPGTFGAGSAVTSQYGFVCEATLTGATNNYGFHSSIPSGTGRWNFYAAGTAANYFAGITTFADTTDASTKDTGAVVIEGGLGVEKTVWASGYCAGIAAKTTAYTATATDHTLLVSGNTTITLPAAASNTGRIYVIKKTDTAGTTVTVDGNASETIDGSTTVTLTAQYQSITIQCDGTNWHII